MSTRKTQLRKAIADLADLNVDAADFKIGAQWEREQWLAAIEEMGKEQEPSARLEELKRKMGL